ncbi:MAG: hypothetical protein ABFS35_09735 [Bacteroidota bacterium]
MKIKNILFGLISIMLVIAACKKDYSNPEFADDEIAIYLYGSGARIQWTEHFVTVGDSLSFQLQVAPPAETSYKWMLNDVEVSTSLKYTYHAIAEGTENLYFIATKANYSDTAIFQMNSVLEGESSKLNEWQSFEIENQTGEFTAEFDMVASADNIDAVTGFLSGLPSGFGDLSTIVRFTKEGRLDARNAGAYEYIDDIPYTAGTNYHVRMEVDMATNTYDVFVTPEGGSEQTLATDYGFRKPSTSINYWAIIYGDWEPVNVGSHRVSNMTITTRSQNEAPVLAQIEDQSMVGGSVIELTISASDPLGEGVVFSTADLPRFATFVDNGDGTATFTFKPYGECGGCDDGNYNIIVNATNRLHTTTDAFIVSVANTYEVVADVADASIYDYNKNVDPTYHKIFAGKIDPDWLPDYTGPTDMAAVMPFLIPELPAGTRIANVELKLEVTTNNSWVATDYDLYGINARDNADVLSSDFFTGEYDTDTNTDVTAVEQAIIQNGDAAGPGIFGTTGLAGFISDQVQNGATGKYVFLRINANRTDLPAWAHLQVQAANDDPDNPGFVKPTLVIYLEPAK